MIPPLLPFRMGRQAGFPTFAAMLALAVTIVSASAPAQTPSQAPPQVTVANPLERELVEYQEFTGQFAAVEYVELRSRVSGYLQSHHFEEGQLVKKGDLLFVIDPRPFEASLASAKAELVQAEARVELANRQLSRAAQLRQRDFVASSIYDERLPEQRVAAAAAEISKAAIANAENNHQLDVDRLFVKEAFVGKAFVMKRFKARARGRGARIVKPFSNLTIVVREREDAE